MLITTPKASIWKKLNPILGGIGVFSVIHWSLPHLLLVPLGLWILWGLYWWLGNQYNPVESEPQFLPKYPLWIRRIVWALRNPGENFNRMVIGFWDQGARAWCPFGGNPNGDWRDDGGRWNFMLVTPTSQLGAGWLWFPFLSFRGCVLETYAGWDHGGKFGLALRIARATAY